MNFYTLKNIILLISLTSMLLLSSFPNVYSQLHFGPISAVKNKINNIKEIKRQIQEEKANSRLLEDSTDINGKVVLYDQVALKSIIIEVKDKINQQSLAGIKIKYLNTGYNIICEFNDPSNRYYPHIIIKSYNDIFVGQYNSSNKNQAVPILGLIVVGLTVYKTAKTVYEYAVGSEDIPSIEIIQGDQYLDTVCITGDFDDLWNLFSLGISIISAPSSLTMSGQKVVSSVAKWVGMGLVKDEFNNIIDTDKEYRICYHKIKYSSIIIGPAEFHPILENELTLIKYYSLPNTMSAGGLCWDGTRIWSLASGFLYFTKIYKHNMNSSLSINTTYYAPSFLSDGPSGGLTWDGTNIWSCDFSTDKIYKHNMNSNLSIATTFYAPGTHPNGLTWDGSTIWSCDAVKDKIYKHNMDSTLSVNTTYYAPGDGIGDLTWDGTNIWSCDIFTNKVYKHNMDSTLSVSKIYSLQFCPDGLMWGAGNLWCSGYSDGTIYRFIVE